jgi:hypothetical protein
MDWILDGKRVMGKYLNEYFFTGVVQESRVKYGGTVSNTIVLDEPIEVFGELRTKVLMDSDQLKVV